ncbi:hypothetical protein B0O99DRAFT_517625 [Bisporella sp. PMI_857]|nr:hypothetical protein B0O99DRAFT_517625 [Bisporella sp. PMI_857]
MDPLHITEFASPRYYDKLNQVSETAKNGSPSSEPAGSTSASTSTQAHTIEQQTFTLPINLRHPEIPPGLVPLRSAEQKKRSIGHNDDYSSTQTQRRPKFFGSKGTLHTKFTLVKKAPTVSTLVEHHEHIVAAEGRIYERLPLSELFLSLPNELQEHIIAPLPIHDVLNLRLVSKSFHTLVTLNEHGIARYHVAHTLPSYALRLYPQPNPADINLHYVCGIWHRLHVASKLSIMIARQTVREIFLKTTEAQLLEFEPQHRRMRQRLMPIVFTLFHFFESYRALHVRHLAEHGAPLNHQAFTYNPIECQVMEMYDDQTLLKVHQAWAVVISSFSRRLRPPSYIGQVERAIKGYLKDRPPDEVYTTILAVGGLRQAQRFWETKGYNARRDAVDTWYGFITRCLTPVEPVTVLKSKMSRLHIGRRKKDVSLPAAEAAASESAGHDAGGCKEWFCVKPACQAARRRHSTDNLVFHSSLAAGPPMSPLSPAHLQLLLPDLQHLSNIWIHTAEALILERKIVARPQEIKKNAAVFLELIKDDGVNDLEEWSSGIPRTAHTEEQQDDQ